MLKCVSYNAYAIVPATQVPATARRARLHHFLMPVSTLLLGRPVQSDTALANVLLYFSKKKIKRGVFAPPPLGVRYGLPMLPSRCPLHNHAVLPIRVTHPPLLSSSKPLELHYHGICSISLRHTDVLFHHASAPTRLASALA